MDDIILKKLTDAVQGKVSKKSFILILITAFIFHFDLSHSLLIPVLKETWLGIVLIALIILITQMLLRKSRIEGEKDYIVNLEDRDYDISDSYITVSIKDRNKYRWIPYQEIILFNTSPKHIARITGHVDFYRNNIRSDVIAFEIDDLPADKGHRIVKFLNEDRKYFWDYATVSYVMYDSQINTEHKCYTEGNHLLKIYPDLNDLTPNGQDRRWLKEKIRHCGLFIQNFGSMNRYCKKPHKHEGWRKNLHFNLLQISERTERYLRNALILLTGIILLVILLLLFAIFAYNIYRFAFIHIDWFLDKSV